MTLVFLWAVALAGPIALVSAQQLGFSTLPLGWASWDPSKSLDVLLVEYNPLFHLPSFLIGMYSADWFLKRGPMFPRRAVTGIVVSTVAITGLTLTDIPSIFVNNGIMAPAFILLIYALASGGTAVSHFLGSAAICKLGDASYAMYILQMPVFFLCRYIMRALKTGRDPDSVWFVAFFTFALIVGSLLISALAETLRAKTNFTPRRNGRLEAGWLCP